MKLAIVLILCATFNNSVSLGLESLTNSLLFLQQLAIVKFSRYIANTSQYVENFYEFENLDNGDVKMNTTIVFKVDVLTEMVNLDKRLKVHD
jgi:hypothetical protein